MSPEEFRRSFLQQLDGIQPLMQLLDLLPDVAFFMKDREGRFVMHNRRGYEYCRVATEHETIGKTDYDFYPRDRADVYVAGDRQVMKTGSPILNAIAPAPEDPGSQKLIVYSKVPLRNRRGEIIGVAGFHREVHGIDGTTRAFGRLSKALQHLHDHFAESLTTTQLAKLAGLSQSQFDRKFLTLFGTTPRRYLLRIRIHAACRLLATSDSPITDIALEVGFYDHSHFTRTFRRQMGISPLAYRQQRQAAAGQERLETSAGS